MEMNLSPFCFICLISFGKPTEGFYRDRETRIPYDKSNNFKIKVYWNIPSFQCDYHQLNFSGLAEKYGIFQNNNDRFYGNVINILYDPGDFPAILESGSKTILRNGGVPQEGNLHLHLKLFEQRVHQAIPDINFDGLAIIDFENWRPVYRQNFGSLQPYKDLSEKIEKDKHPSWSNHSIEAAHNFELFARKFISETLKHAKKLRKNASWGFYAYPYCFNMSPSNMNTACPHNVVKENDKISWFFEHSDNLHPSLYVSEIRLTELEKIHMIIGRIDEANRIRNNFKKEYKVLKIFPYIWYKYYDTRNFLSKDDLYNTLSTLSNSEIDGIIIWGSSLDVNNKTNCYELYDYLNNILGPAIIDNKFYHRSSSGFILKSNVYFVIFFNLILFFIKIVAEIKSSIVALDKLAVREKTVCFF